MTKDDYVYLLTCTFESGIQLLPIKKKLIKPEYIISGHDLDEFHRGQSKRFKHNPWTTYIKSAFNGEEPNILLTHDSLKQFQLELSDGGYIETLFYLLDIEDDTVSLSPNEYSPRCKKLLSIIDGLLNTVGECIDRLDKERQNSRYKILDRPSRPYSRYS